MMAFEDRDVRFASESSTEINVDMESDKEYGGRPRDEEETATSANDLQKIASVNDESSIPNGGLTAWLVVLGSFLCFLNTWGVINSFGGYQTYYERELLPGVSPSAISWIGSIQAFLAQAIAACVGPAYDAGYFRSLVVTGSSMVVIGNVALSFCTQYYQILLAQALCIGLGAGLMLTPSVAILSTYFTTHISTAVGIAASGSSLGGIIYPIVLQRLQTRIGFPWTMRVIALISLVTLLVANLTMRTRTRPAQKRRMFDIYAFKETPYLTFNVGAFIAFMGAYVPMFYVQLYGLGSHITNDNLSFYLLSILNAGSTLGRIVPNVLADHIGPFNAMVPCAVLSGVMIFCLLAVRQAAALVVFCVLYGFFAGSFVSIIPSILVSLSPTRGVVGTRMGNTFTVISVALLIGNPIAGAILKLSGFRAIWIYGGCFTLVGGVLIGIARGFQVKWKLWTRI